MLFCSHQKLKQRVTSDVKDCKLVSISSRRTFVTVLLLSIDLARSPMVSEAMAAQDEHELFRYFLSSLPKFLFQLALLERPSNQILTFQISSSQFQVSSFLTFTLLTEKFSAQSFSLPQSRSFRELFEFIPSEDARG